MQQEGNRPLTPESRAALTGVYIRKHHVLASRDVLAGGTSTAADHIMTSVTRAWRALAKDA
jgi:hypothetical protein